MKPTGGLWMFDALFPGTGRIFVAGYRAMEVVFVLVQLQKIKKPCGKFGWREEGGRLPRKPCRTWLVGSFTPKTVR